MGPMTIEKGVKSMTITFHDAEDEPVDTTRTPFTLVWLTTGRVVAVGTDVWSEPVERFRGDGERRFVAVHAAQGRPYSAD